MGKSFFFLFVSLNRWIRDDKALTDALMRCTVNVVAQKCWWLYNRIQWAEKQEFSSVVEKDYTSPTQTFYRQNLRNDSHSCFSRLGEKKIELSLGYLNFTLDRSLILNWYLRLESFFFSVQVCIGFQFFALEANPKIILLLVKSNRNTLYITVSLCAIFSNVE